MAIFAYNCLPGVTWLLCGSSSLTISDQSQDQNQYLAMTDDGHGQQADDNRWQQCGVGENQGAVRFRITGNKDITTNNNSVFDKLMYGQLWLQKEKQRDMRHIYSDA